MRIGAISTNLYKNQTAFKKVYMSDDNFNKDQKKIVEDIQNKIRSVDPSDKKGRTFEEKFADKGLHFLITNYSNKNSQVALEMIKNVKRVKDTSDEIYYSKASVLVGKYDKKHKFDTDHIEEARAMVTVNNNLLLAAFSPSVIMGLVMAYGALTTHKTPSKMQNETVTTFVKDSTKTISDTAKNVIEFVKK